jgi:hypothetical protein
MGFKTFNDRLAFVYTIVFAGLWILNHWYPLPGEVLGASIAIETLIAQYYFRKAAPESATTEPKTTPEVK